MSEQAKVKRPKRTFDISSTQGSLDAEAERGRLYKWMMQTWSPTQRYEYLVRSGWQRLGKTVTDGLHVKKAFITIQWEMPAAYLQNFRAKDRIWNQTRAILIQIWWDMEDNGFITYPGKVQITKTARDLMAVINPREPMDKEPIQGDTLDLFSVLDYNLADHLRGYCMQPNTFTQFDSTTGKYYWDWEKEVATPALQVKGFQVLGVVNLDADSFGPLVRAFIVEKEGRKSKLVYG
jgi:hypothetical protein